VRGAQDGAAKSKEEMPRLMVKSDVVVNSCWGGQEGERDQKKTCESSGLSRVFFYRYIDSKEQGKGEHSRI